MKLLSQQYHNQLRCIQGLPQTTSRVAVYLMLGALPMEALYHQQMLTLFGAICLIPSSNKLSQLGKRQLISEEASPNSWFVRVKQVADIYGIDACENMLNPVSKTLWKSLTNSKITQYHNDIMQSEASSRHTLRWIIWSRKWQGRTGNPHPIRQACRGDPYRSAGAAVRLRMLVGRYPLNKDKFQYRTGKDPLCPLCSAEDEDITHMLIWCSHSRHLSEPKIELLRKIYVEQGCRPPGTEPEITSAILNGWAYSSQTTSLVVTDSSVTQNYDTELYEWDIASIICSSLCLKLDKFREKAMESAKPVRQ